MLLNDPLSAGWSMGVCVFFSKRNQTQLKPDNIFAVINYRLESNANVYDHVEWYITCKALIKLFEVNPLCDPANQIE